MEREPLIVASRPVYDGTLATRQQRADDEHCPLLDAPVPGVLRSEPTRGSVDPGVQVAQERRVPIRKNRAKVFRPRWPVHPRPHSTRCRRGPKCVADEGLNTLPKRPRLNVPSAFPLLGLDLAVARPAAYGLPRNRLAGVPIERLGVRVCRAMYALRKWRPSARTLARDARSSSRPGQCRRDRQPSIDGARAMVWRPP